MRTRTLFAATTLLFVGSVSASAGTPITPTKILGGPEYQVEASSNGTYLGWTQNSERKPRSWHAYVSTDPVAGKTRLDAPGTNGFFGDIDTDSNEAVYQQTDGGVSDIYLVLDVSIPVPTPLDDINTSRWEWQPRLSDQYVLFTRDYPRLGVRRLFLYDRATFLSMLLKEVAFGTLLITGDVGSSHATWTICGRTCNAWIYDIDMQTPTKIPTVNDRPQYSPVVDEVNEKVYWVRSEPACGAGVGFWKAPLSDPSAETNIASLRAGIDTGWNASLERDIVNQRIDLIFSRHNCSTGEANIFELREVDTLP